MYYSKEPWREGAASSIVSDDAFGPMVPGAEMVEHYGGYMVAESVADGNRRRIVACVNACRGLPTDELEQKGLVAAVGTELLEADRQRDQLKALSVEHILVDVVPGHDGMGQEVYAKSVDDVIALLSKLSGEVDELEIHRDQLQTQVENTHGLWQALRRDLMSMKAQRDQLLAERDVLRGAVKKARAIGAAQLAEVIAERDQLRTVCAEAYQFAGAYDAPVEVLDNLSAAANGWPLPHESFLPVMDSEAVAERDQLLAELEKALDSLEYVEQHLPDLAGYGVRQERITSGRAAIAAVKGGAPC